MMTKEMLLEDHYIDDYVDDHVDREIESCFSASSPNNFFVFAGAGSGKTRSLMNTLNFLDKEQGEKLLMKGKQIAVITYTNAACDEISRRLQYKSIFFSIYNTQLFVGVNKELSSGYKNVDYGICSKRNRRTETKAD